MTKVQSGPSLINVHVTFSVMLIEHPNVRLTSTRLFSCLHVCTVKLFQVKVTPHLLYCTFVILTFSRRHNSIPTSHLHKTGWREMSTGFQVLLSSYLQPEAYFPEFTRRKFVKTPALPSVTVPKAFPMETDRRNQKFWYPSAHLVVSTESLVI